MIKRLLRKAVQLQASAVVSPLVLACKLHRKLDPKFEFHQYGYLVGMIPTEIGRQLRRAFYRQTLRHVGESLRMEYGSYFVSPDTSVGDHFNCGAYCIIGRSTIGDYVMLASRCSVLDGLTQHGYDDLETPMVFQQGAETQVNIGRNVWIGEGAIVGADVGDNTIVGVGSVTMRPARPNTVMLGNPARVVRHRGQSGSVLTRVTTLAEGKPAAAGD